MTGAEWLKTIVNISDGLLPDRAHCFGCKGETRGLPHVLASREYEDPETVHISARRSSFAAVEVLAKVKAELGGRGLAYDEFTGTFTGAVLHLRFRVPA